MTSTTPSFFERWQTLRKGRGPFCLNLDPSERLLRDWSLPVDAEGLRHFCAAVLEAAEDRVGVIKPQSAYFERFGPAGLEVLRDVIAAIRSRGSLALLDAKRGDIGSTNEGYAAGLLGPGSALQADALTVHAYLGFAALQPLLERACATGCGIFAVVLSSNPEGRVLQAARTQNGVTVAEALAEEITAYNAKLGDEAVGPVGAVVGLTAEAIPETLARLPRSLILAPGLGAQGGTIEDLVRRFASVRSRVLPCSGREVLAAGPDRTRLRAAIGDHCARTHEVLG